jgi:hypothetical protein
LFGPETSNVLIINAETVIEISMRHCQVTHAYIIEISHVQLDDELPPLAPTLPAAFVTESITALAAPASGVLGVNIWSDVSLP